MTVTQIKLIFFVLVCIASVVFLFKAHHTYSHIQALSQPAAQVVIPDIAGIISGKSADDQKVLPMGSFKVVEDSSSQDLVIEIQGRQVKTNIAKLSSYPCPNKPMLMCLRLPTGERIEITPELKQMLPSTLTARPRP